MTNLPAFTEATDPTIKSLININDMIKARFALATIKSTASLKGFESIAKARSFKAAKLAVANELKAAGLIVI